MLFIHSSFVVGLQAVNVAFPDHTQLSIIRAYVKRATQIAPTICSGFTWPFKHRIVKNLSKCQVVRFEDKNGKKLRTNMALHTKYSINTSIIIS